MGPRIAAADFDYAQRFAQRLAFQQRCSVLKLDSWLTEPSTWEKHLSPQNTRKDTKWRAKSRSDCLTQRVKAFEVPKQLFPGSFSCISWATQLPF